MDSDGPLHPFHLKVRAPHWFLPALLSAALIPSSHLGASAQEAAPPDGQVGTADGAMPAPARGLVPGPGRPVGDAAGLGADVLGDGAVRRTFTAPADGWYRLAARGGHARWAVTVLGGGTRSVLASSRWEDHLEGGALIHARAGAGLAVLVGALDGPGGGFELAWSGAAAPVRLRPAGRLPDGGRDALGVPVEMRRPGDLAFGAGRLFMASGLGLSAYARDPATGGLALEHLVDADVAGALLAWDEGRSRLLAHDCGRWTAFGVGADGAPGPARAVPADGDPAHCGRPLVDAGGGLVHRAGAGGVDLFSVGPDGGLRYEGTAAVPGLRGAALGGSGEVYAAGAAGLAVVSRRDGSSRPWAAPAGIGLSAPAAARVPLAVGAGGGLLLAADAGGARLFALGGGASPVPLGVLPLASGVGDAAGCAFAALRPGGVADALCGGRLATAQWLGGAAGFAAGSTSAAVGAPVGMAATPDGRRVYVSTPEDGILAFERVPGEGPDSTADDHGDDPATATVVTIPSTTAGELGLGDRDYFRIDIIRAGILTFETTGSTDTYGTLHDGDGTVLEEDDDRGPRPTNFGISDVLLFEGTYFVEVKEVRGVTGAYELRVTGDARSAGKPAATAPSVSINTIPTGNEGTEVRLGATLTGGAYDGAADYAWSVDGGTLDSPSSATPIWTRPAVDSNANHTVRLTVTVRGTGTNAESGTSDTAGANRQALVRDVPPPLPAADAPAVTVNAIPDGNENTTARLGATLTGGTYDGTPEFAWTVTGGRLSNPNSATPTWTRPTVNADDDYTVRLTVTVRGRGTNARSGTSERADANRTARVLDVPAQLPVAAAPSVSINAIPAGNEGTAVQLGATLNGGTYDGAVDYAWTVTGGTLNNPAAATPTWTRPSVASNTNYTVRLTVTARGAGTAARSGTSDTANTSRTAQVRNVAVVLPVAAAPSVTINAIPAGDENANVQLAATLNGGTYDGAVDYAWTATGGTLDDPAAATPTWTRPSVASNTNHTVRLTVTARGAGTTARNGTSDTANATFSAQVRNVAVVLPVAAAPSVTINAIPAGDENANVQLTATLNGGTYDGAAEYAWSVNGGALDSAGSATPTWARPSVTSNTNHTVSLTITVRGSGTTARSGTSDTASTTRTAQVRDTGGTTGDHGNDRASATTVGIPSTTTGTITAGDRDYFRIDVSQAGSLRLRTTGNTDTYGTLFDSGGSKTAEDDDSGPPRRNFLIVRGSVGVGTHYLEVRGWGRRTAGDYTLEVTGTARSTGTQLPAASAPSVTINAVPAGDEGTGVQLGAALTGGTYDGAPDYAWSVSGGTLDNANLATPTWTRPAVNADANHTVSLTVSVKGSGANASNGTSDTASTSRTAQVRDVPLQLPPAAAPSVSINAIPAGNEGTDVQLSAALGSGTHDGAVEYQWSVDGGVLDNANAATPTWTRPSVTSNTNHTVSLTITVRGTGTTARNGTSDTANTSRSAQVRNVVVLLPAASAPTVTINAVPAGNENTAVQLGATLSGGGTYDGAVEYDWSVDGGVLNDSTLATPTWTRPSVSSDSSRTVSLTVTVRGTGTAASNGTSDTASASLTAQVRDAGDHGNDQASATRVAIPSTTAGTLTSRDRDYFRIEVGQAGSLRLETTSGLDTYGTLLRGDGSQVARNDDGGGNYNFRISMGSIGAGVYYLQVRGFHHTTTGPYSLEVSGTARGPGGLPAASAPAVSIDSIPAGDEGTAVQLGATLAGGTYDGAVNHAWSVSGGTLDNANLAAPTWTRPAVNADANHTVSLTVSVDGSGTNAGSGTSDTASASRTAQVRDVPAQLPPAAAPSVSINAIPAGNEGTDVQLSAALGSGTHDGAVEHRWSVDGGVLDNANAATPTWTRPSVTSNTNRTVSLTVTVRGTGTTARSGSSDTANASRTALVRNVAVLLPAASAPTVTINAVPAGNESTTVQLGAALTGGGPYDGAVEYDWSVNGGTLDDGSAATPTWTRPSVTSDANRTVSLTITVRGTGATARSGTSDTASASRSAEVRDAGDHGNDRASATLVGIPSTTAGTLARRDRDWFRIEVGQAGTLRLETRSGIDTYGTLHRSDGSKVAENDDGGSNYNFRISRSSVGVGTYYLQVRGYNGSTRGDYSLEVSGTARAPGTVPLAAAPSVTIDAVPAGDEGTDAQLGAALDGGTYDGAAEYAWIVDGGTLDDPASATPTWTRPSVESDTSHTASLAVTVRGTGTAAVSGSSDTARASRSALVRDVAAAPATAPSVSINAIPAGDEGGTVQLGAALDGGAYDGAPEYAWSVDGGTLDDPASATPTWTRPTVTSNANYTVRLTVAVVGSGTKALNGSRDTAGTSRSALVRDVPAPLPPATAPSVSIDAIPAGDEGGTVQLGATVNGGAYDGAVEYAWTVDGGTLDDPASATPTWTCPTVDADTDHTVRLTVTVVGSGTKAVNGSRDTASTSRSASVRDVPPPLPPAAAPSVSINTIPAGDEGTDVQLGAALGGGTYDGTPDYAWTVDGGTLDDPASATPTWTRPAVTSDTNYTVSLTVTVGGSGITASNGSSDTANTSLMAQARDVASPLPVASAPTVSFNFIPAGYEGTTVQLGATLAGGTYDGAAEYVWSVDGGTLDNANLAAPTWTRPLVSSNTHHTLSLRVRVRGAGTTARSGTSDAVNLSRSIQVRNGLGDDHGHNRGTATPVSIPSSTAGVIERGDTDWFRFKIDQAGPLVLKTTGGVDTWGRLYRSEGSFIAYNEDDGAGFNFRIAEASLDPGVYYIEVRGYGSATGAYRLEVAVTDDDHGNDRGSATSVAIPSTTAGVLERRDRDYFRIDIAQAGTLQLQTKGSGYIDTYGVLYGSNGSPIESDLNSGKHANFLISMDSLSAGTYFLEVRGNRWSDRGAYRLEVSGTARGPTTLPVAVAPSVSVNAIPDDDEGTSVQLRATLSGGTYDGTLEYAWSVDGGVLDNASSATPTWTRPAVTANTNHTIGLTVTARGAGTVALNGTSDTATVSRAGLVRDIPPVAAAPAVSINAIAGGDEGTTVQLGAALSGGAYDGAPEYAWSVDGGRLDDPTSATPTWTRPSVATSTQYTASLTVRVQGTGTAALSGSSATANASRTAQVRDVASVLPVAAAPSVAIDAIPLGKEGTTVQLGATLAHGTYDGAPEYLWSVDGGALDDASAATPTWTRPTVSASASYTVRLKVSVRGSGITARSGTSGTASTSRSVQVSQGGGDDHGNNRATATPVVVPSTTPGVLEPWDRDWFRIETDEAGPLTLEAAGGIWTWGKLYDSDGRQIAQNTYGGINRNFRISRRSIDAGVYYLEVRGIDAERGAYSVKVSRFSNDHGHDQASATPVSIPSTTAGMLERYDRDWFRIDLAQAGTLRLETTGETNTFGTLYSADGSELAQDDHSHRTSTNFRILMDSVAAGTYYLEVRGGFRSTRGAYGLEVSGTARGSTTQQATAPSVSVNAHTSM